MKQLSSDKLMLLNSNPAAPVDYVDWLQKNGWGGLSSDRYMLYDGLIELEDIAPDAPSGYLTFGDDMAGCNGCFSLAGDGVVYEYVSDTGEVRGTGKQFGDYIRAYA